MWPRIGTLAALSLFGVSSLTVGTAAQTPSNGDGPTVTNSADSDVDVDPPRLTWAPNPKYPKSARNVGHQGTSILNLVVGTDGKPHDITIVRPLDGELDAFALAAVQKWRYRPALRDGEPVEVQVHARVRFRLYNKSYGRIAELWDRSDHNDPRADRFEFLKMAADWNLPEAQFLMGERYNSDSPPDYVNAYMWYALSKRAGGQDGARMLKLLASEMSPEQLSEADLRVDYWPEDPPRETATEAQ